jgi:hypothetical protein
MLPIGMEDVFAKAYILNGTDKCYNKYKYTWMKKNIYGIGALKNG